MWVAATLIASLAQTGRNAAQAGLTARIGTMGATGVRFLFGLPFAILFLSLVALVDETRAIVRAFSGGPHIFNLGHGITPDADPENVALMIRTVREGA